MTPSYIRLAQSNELEKRASLLRDELGHCCLCPRFCNVNRLKGETGFCRTGRLARVSSSFLHYGEEPELVGIKGSGTIFFAWCNLGCIYCQNYSLSHLGEGSEVTADELAAMMLDLQEQGAHNINFVTPTHVIAQIVEALPRAVEKGLCLPLVYNCGGYEEVRTLKMLEGIFDIYMPDLKYSSNEIAGRLSAAPDYWEKAGAALKEMHRQTGDLQVSQGLAFRGLLVRHLVLPQGLAGSQKIFEFIVKEISPRTYVNIMDQYRPCYRAEEYPPLARRVTGEEYSQALTLARSLGLQRGFSR